MKRKTLCAFSLILYVLVVCTLLSQKIEVEMQTQVEAHTVYGSRIFEQEIELPISYLFSQDSTSHLFEIKDGTGWESGLRSQEISSQDWSVRRTTPDLEKVILNPGRDYTFICTASRVPQSGELVEVIDEPEIAADTYLVYYPEGVPNFDELPSGTKEISRSENALLLSVENGKYPFFEHRAIGDDLKQIAASHMRVFSLSAVQSFLEQIPSLTWVLVLLIIPVLLWAFSCVLSINADRNKPFIALNILLVIVCLFLLQSVLAKIDLPAVMLPDENIFDLQHYSKEFVLVFNNLNSLGAEADSLFAVRTYITQRSLHILLLGSICAVCVPALESLILFRSARQKSAKMPTAEMRLLPFLHFPYF